VRRRGRRERRMGEGRRRSRASYLKYNPYYRYVLFTFD